MYSFSDKGKLFIIGLGGVIKTHFYPEPVTSYELKSHPAPNLIIALPFSA